MCVRHFVINDPTPLQGGRQRATIEAVTSDYSRNSPQQPRWYSERKEEASTVNSDEMRLEKREKGKGKREICSTKFL
jgi:hypothetical protein